MFSKSQRYSFKNGIPTKRLDTSYFSLRYQKSQDNVLHCAIIISKKVDKSSVVRHKLKRKFVSVIKDFIKDRNLGYDLVFYLKKSVQGKDFTEIKQKIEEVLISLN